MDWNGRVAFVTGGVSGIGFGVARAFSNAGMRRPAARDAAAGKAIGLGDLT